MSDTTFSNGTVIQPDWLNDVNRSIYAGVPAAGTLRAEVYGRTAQEIAASVTPSNYAYVPGDSRRYATLADAFLGSDFVFIFGVYTVTTPIQPRSNMTVWFNAGAKIVLGGGIINQYIMTATGITNTVFYNATLEGNGLAGLSAVLLISSSKIIFEVPTITKSGSMGIQLDGCSYCQVLNGDLSENYYYGIMDRDGNKNSFIGNRCYRNGNTGVATSTGGRGIHIHRTVGDIISNNRFIENTEYGFRLYSEAADSSSSYDNLIIGNIAIDNVACDFVLYDESLTGALVKENMLQNNISRRSTVPTGGYAFLVHGGDNTLDNCQVIKSGAFGNFGAFYLYYGVRNRILNSKVKNIAHCVVFSNATDCVVDGLEGITVATGNGVAGFIGSGNVFKNSKLVHGGGGTTDDCFTTYNATGKSYIENNIIDGFRHGVYIEDEAVRICGNTTINSTVAGFKKGLNPTANQEYFDNNWDSADPVYFRNINKVGQTTTLTAATFPAGNTWAVGARCFNETPSPGNPKSWVVTSAGTPGTWTSEGNL